MLATKNLLHKIFTKGKALTFIISGTLLVVIIAVTFYQVLFLPKISMDSYNANIKIHNESIANYSRIIEDLAQNISDGEFSETGIENLKNRQKELESLNSKNTSNIKLVSNKGNKDAQNFADKTAGALKIYEIQYTQLLNIFKFQICNNQIQQNIDNQNKQLKDFNPDKISNQNSNAQSSEYSNFKDIFDANAKGYKKWLDTCVQYVFWHNTDGITTSLNNLIKQYKEYSITIGKLAVAIDKQNITDLELIKKDLQKSDFSNTFNQFLDLQNQLRVKLFDTVTKIHAEIKTTNEELIDESSRFKKQNKV